MSSEIDMLEDFEKQYISYYRELQRQQWANYFEGAYYDISAIDEEIYKLACFYSGRINTNERKGQIAELIIRRERVDKARNVSEIRNYIDNLDNFTQNIPDEIKKDTFRYRSEMGKRMKNYVLQLMDRRNSLAISFGYDSYVDLVLHTEEIEKEKLLDLLNLFLENNLNKATTIIKKYCITFENWFADLNTIFKINHDPDLLIDDLLARLGYSYLKDGIKIFYTHGGIFGYASELSPDDIRLAIAPVESLNGLRTLLHELGHVIFYRLCKEKGLLRILPAGLDEPMAVVFEYIAPLLILNKEDKDKINELMILEYVRCCLSALFEFDLWEMPDKAEELFLKHYSKLGPKISDPDIWAYDSFRSIDPVYIYNYVIGARIAKELIKHLNNCYSHDFSEWGKWLYYNVYYDGRRRTLQDKIHALGDFV